MFDFDQQGSTPGALEVSEVNESHHSEMGPTQTIFNGTALDEFARDIKRYTEGFDRDQMISFIATLAMDPYRQLQEISPALARVTAEEILGDDVGTLIDNMFVGTKLAPFSGLISSYVARRVNNEDAKSVLTSFLDEVRAEKTV